MSGLFGMLFALAGTLWAMPYLLVAAGVGLVIWLLMREVRRQGERELAERRRRRATAARADRQHQLVMRGDPRGTYGIAWPTVRRMERLQR